MSNFYKWFIGGALVIGISWLAYYLYSENFKAEEGQKTEPK